MEIRPSPSRRDFITGALTALPGLSLMACTPRGATAPAAPSSASLPPPAPSTRVAAPTPPVLTSGTPLNVVCVAAHPDDAESGCGGTLARYAAAGHHVTIVYLTRGEMGIQGKSPEETASIRSSEAQQACAVLGAKALFAGQRDGATEITRATSDHLRELVAPLKPDVFFAHWPMDTHLDHQIAGLLAIRTYLLLPRRYPLYFFEVETGTQSIGFTPATFVDITPVRERKIQALFAHKSQNPEGLYDKHHEPMERFRGRELGVNAAEAFAVLSPDTRTGMLPGVL
jgi:LmbE family N-acetylglucosaminyl deacetylase